MRVLLVTTWGTACGIAEHSAYLKEAVEKADPGIEIIPSVESLDPWSPAARALLYDPAYYRKGDPQPEIVHLNYQASLHSRWIPEAILDLQSAGRNVVVTYHDTGVPNSDQCKQIAYVLRPRLDMMIVHESFEDLPIEKTRYWRMGIPDWDHREGEIRWGHRPSLGTVGFPFPWKCYDQLAMVTAKAGWGLYLIAPNATDEQIREWHRLNPNLLVYRDFMKREDVVNELSGCDATAFTYVTHNTGQSGAVLQGIATRKPVIALSTCRQFRALHADDVGHRAIRWATTFEEVYDLLISMPIARVDPATVALAEQDSWQRLGQKYAELYRSLE